MNTSNAIRATFVMQKGNRDLLKGVAYRYGVSQSEIMNTAPYLFIVMAERSLAERRVQLTEAETHAEQARKQLEFLPSHLVIGDAQERIEEAIQLEEQSIQRKQLHGPNVSDIEEFMNRDFGQFGDPFQKSVTTALEEVGANATAERYKSMLNGEDDDSFLDEEEKAVRDAFLDKIIGNIDLNELVENSEIDEDSQNDGSIKGSGTVNGIWQIYLRGEVISANSGADALERFIRRLVADNPVNLEKMLNVRGRIRPLIAETPEQLYPGRPDLCDLSREFTPGWFVGTNYSHRDVRRLLRAAAEEVGLAWGVDVYVSTNLKPQQGT